MQEFRWEIWSDKQNFIHKVQMDLSERPIDVFQRINEQLKNTEHALKLRMMNPNTGREVDTQWKFSYRLRGQAYPLKEGESFESQGVQPGALLVLRPVEIRANTIYIESTEGLGLEELSAAKSKTPYIVLAIILLLIFGGIGYYYIIELPRQEAMKPYEIKVATMPTGSTVRFTMDVSTIENYKKKFRISGQYLQRSGETSKVNRYSLKIPKKAKIIYVEISHKGYIPWKKGLPLKKWQQLGQKNYIPIKQILAKNFFPKALKKLPPKPKFKVVPPSSPKPLTIKYPRRWRGLRFGLDPMLGGEELGAVGPSGTPASKINLTLAMTIKKHLRSRKLRRRRYRVYISRKKDRKLHPKRRYRILRRSHVIIQLNMASALKEFPKNNQKIKKNGKTIVVNNGIAGFQIFWNPKNKRAKKTQKLAQCLATAMKQAGFIPKAPRKEEKNVTNPELGIRTTSDCPVILAGRKPAVRLIPGYLSHEKEDALFNNPETLNILAQVMEQTAICYKKRR